MAVEHAQDEGIQNGAEGAAPDPLKDSVNAVRKGSKVAEDLSNATAWFLSEQDAGEMASKVIEVDVGASEEHYVRWRVQAITRERIRQIRTQARIKRGRGLGDEVNDVKANLLIATEGTVDPNLVEIASRIGAPDAATVLDRRLSHKPGLVDLIAGAVLEVSGYDDEDVRDVATVKG